MFVQVRLQPSLASFPCGLGPVKKDGVGFRIRLPFPHEATDRKAVKEILVEMTRAAAGQK